jgi:hypothetical protein
MRALSMSVAVAAMIALSSGFTVTQAEIIRDARVSDTPSHAGTTGIEKMENRSPSATRHGAKKRGFCPPGQAKKPGKGSAFKC